MAKRKAISKKVRFEIFKRDGFKCMYCGAHPPSVLLHVDHIKPVADGGGNEDDNLITACEPCNLGKGARLLSNVPTDLESKAAMVAEREAQIDGFQAVMASKRTRLEAGAWEVVNLFLPNEKTVSRDWFNSCRNFIDKLGFDEVVDAMEIAMAKGFYSDKKTFAYFCGICWNRVRKQEGANA